MTRFEHLFRLIIRHGYMSKTPPITVEPDASTASLMGKLSLQYRAGPGRLEVYANTDREDLKSHANGGDIQFVFLLRATEPELVLVTKDIAEAGRKFFVTTKNEDIQGGAVFSPDHLQDVDRNPLLSALDQIQPPLALIRLSIQPETKDAEFTARFANSSRIWTYNVIGGDQDSKFEIRDTGGGVKFNAIDSRVVANGKTAKRFQSAGPIPMTAEPTQRFELLDDGPFGKRVILPVLPAAAPGSGSLDPAGTGLMSDIYVNVT